jgi:hypothetical protein
MRIIEILICHRPLIYRFDLNPASLQDLSHQTRQKQEVATIDYQLLSLPLYLVEALQGLLFTLTK